MEMFWVLTCNTMPAIRDIKLYACRIVISQTSFFLRKAPLCFLPSLILITHFFSLRHDCTLRSVLPNMIIDILTFQSKGRVILFTLNRTSPCLANEPDFEATLFGVMYAKDLVSLDEWTKHPTKQAT